MKKQLLALLALFLAAAVSANAATVSYSTAITWNCNGIGGCVVNGNDVQLGNLIIRYTPNSASPNAPNAPGLTGAGFGDLIPLCASAGACTALTDITGVSLTIDVNQTVPFLMTGFWTGVLGGQISDTQSLNPALATFSPLQFSLSDGAGLNINYFLQQPASPNGYILNSISDNRSTSIQGALNMDSSVPEPSSIALIGLGLAGLAFRRRNS